MCGITAISRARPTSSIHDPAHFMKIAALAIEPRGTDATGFGWVNETLQPGAANRTWYWKTPARAREAIRSAPLDSDMVVAIGHTRAATQGNKANNVNNHPVVDNGIILVHNGIIYNDRTLYRELLGADFVPPAEVDSQVAATLLAKREEIGAYHPTDILGLIRGSAALAWIEVNKPDELHLARCAERPLTIGWTRKGDLVMSSTPETLANASAWANIRVRRVEEVAEGTYLRIAAGEIVERTSFELPKTTTYNYGGTSSGTKASTTSGQRWTKDGWVNRSDGSPVTDDTTEPVKPTSTEIAIFDHDFDDWIGTHTDALGKSLRRDADRREEEIAAWWAANAPDDDIDDETVFPDEITVEPDGTIVELAKQHSKYDSPALRWMAGDEFYATFGFPEDGEMADYVGYPDFWDGLEIHAKYRRNIAEVLLNPRPADEVLWAEWVEMFDAREVEWETLAPRRGWATV